MLFLGDFYIQSQFWMFAEYIQIYGWCIGRANWKKKKKPNGNVKFDRLIGLEDFVLDKCASNKNRKFQIEIKWIIFNSKMWICIELLIHWEIHVRTHTLCDFES